MSRPTTPLPSYDESDAEAFKRALRAANIDESELLASEGDEGSDEEEDAALLGRRPLEPVQVIDPRFDRPTPSPIKRAALIFFVIFMFWLAFNLKGRDRKANVVYASRYSKEYKFRPAASPIITETLKDGRTRLRGAIPATATATPIPTPTKAVKKRRTTKRGSKKGKKAVNRK